MGEAGVDAVEAGAGPVDVGGDVVVDEFEVGAGAEVLDVGEVAGEEVVHRHDAVSGGKEFFAEVGAEEAGSAGDEGDGGVGGIDAFGNEEGEVVGHGTGC